MTPASQDQSASNPELEGKLSALEEQHKKMVEEKASLQERLTKTNQDSLKQQEKYNVSYLLWCEQKMLNPCLPSLHFGRHAKHTYEIDLELQHIWK